jgi:hypothetical protein
MKKEANDVDNTTKQPKQRVLSWPNSNAKCRTLSEGELGKLVLNMVTESLLPVSFVEQPSFKALMNDCQPGATLPTCYSITKGLEKRLENSIVAVKDAMSNRVDCNNNRLLVGTSKVLSWGNSTLDQS